MPTDLCINTIMDESGVVFFSKNRPNFVSVEAEKARSSHMIELQS